MSFAEWFEFQVPGKIICGEKCVETVGLEIEKKGGKRALIVTDKQVEDAGLVDLVKKGMESGKCEIAGIFDEVQPHSEIKIVQKCYEFALENKADCIISVGGGSTIDTAKAVAILMVEGGHILDHQSAIYMPSAPLPLHISIPTTAGTGSESTFSASILDEEQKLKLTYKSPELVPSVALLDPIMTTTLPAHLTASTGIGALSHCIEALHSESRQPLCDSLAHQGIRLISQYLPVAFEEPDNLVARGYMIIAANIGGIVFANVCGGMIHGIANALGGRFKVPHGIANAILLPLCVEFNIENCPEKVAGASRGIAEDFGTDTRKYDDVAAGEKALDHIRHLISDLKVSATLSEQGVKAEALEGTARDAMADGCMSNNPKEPDLDEIMEILKRAF